MKNIIITIDGGACSGKSSAASRLAANLGFLHINTGRLYRYYALCLNGAGYSLDGQWDRRKVIEALSELITFDGQTIICDGPEYDNAIVDSISTGEMASHYAQIPELRECITNTIKELSYNRCVVVDGRDCGSVIFPAADYKFYIENPVECRVRNWASSQHRPVSEEEIQTGIRMIEMRDKRDQQRSIAPMCVPSGAKVINIAGIDIDVVCEQLKKYVLVGESTVYMGKTSKQVKSKRKSLKRKLSWPNLVNHNNIRLENPESNALILGRGRIRKSSITIYGIGNYVEIKDGYDIVDLKLLVRGDHNRIVIGEDFVINYNTNAGAVNICAKDSGNEILIGDYAHIRGEAELVCMEGSRLIIGKNFGMSSETIIRTGDGHRIFDLTSGIRTNTAEDIIIGNDCWVARRAVILKGVSLNDFTILGTGALVTKSFSEKNIILGGNPAKIIKRNVTWLPGRR